MLSLQIPLYQRSMCHVLFHHCCTSIVNSSTKKDLPKLSHYAGAEAADGSGEEADEDVGGDVEGGVEPAAAFEEQQGLHAEGGEGSEAAEEADDEQQPKFLGEPGCLDGERHDEAHDDAAEDVDGEGAERKYGAGEAADEHGRYIAADGAEAAADEYEAKIAG